MKIQAFNAAVFLHVLLAPFLVSADGIPEPSLVLYGSVKGGSGQPLTLGQVNWHITNQTDAVSIASSIIAVNAQYFYIAIVPVETRAVGAQNFVPATNSLGLASAPNTFSRFATVNGTNASIVFSSRGMTN